MFNGISILVGYLISRLFLRRKVVVLFNREGGGGNKRVHIFHKGICSRVNVMAWLEFEFADYDIAVQYFSH